MAPACPERLDAAFLYWIATWRMHRRPAMCRQLDEAAARGVDVRILRSPRAVEAFLASLPPARRARRRRRSSVTSSPGSKRSSYSFIRRV